ncbi:hypothetical protein [Levilactobacillus spicheri]
MTQPVMTKGHKWWLHSSTAMALLAWSLGGTAAQADQTTTTPATDQAADATNQTLQEDQVTLPTASTGDGAIEADTTAPTRLTGPTKSMMLPTPMGPRSPKTHQRRPPTRVRRQNQRRHRKSRPPILQVRRRHRRSRRHWRSRAMSRP